MSGSPIYSDRGEIVEKLNLIIEMNDEQYGQLTDSTSLLIINNYFSENSINLSKEWKKAFAKYYIQMIKEFETNSIK